MENDFRRDDDLCPPDRTGAIVSHFLTRQGLARVPHGTDTVERYGLCVICESFCDGAGVPIRAGGSGWEHKNDHGTEHKNDHVHDYERKGAQRGSAGDVGRVGRFGYRMRGHFPRDPVPL